MQDLLRKNLTHFILLFFIAVTIIAWFAAFPIKTKFDQNDILFESIYLIVAFVCYYLIVKLDIKLLQWGWAMLCYALVVDLLDEFTKEPEFWGTIFQGTIESLGIILVAFGFQHSLRKTQSELQNAQSARNELDHIAHHDSLTGLPNRILFTDRLLQSIASAKRNEELLAVHFIDIDNFKDINDTLGHHYGDQVLREVAYRLRTCIRDTDTIARWGGDEFSIIQTNLNVIEDAEIVARKMIEVLSKKFELGRADAQLTISIGIALYPLDSINFDELLSKADKAMYMAKDIKGSAFDVFNHSEN
ncbi:MAG: diguanylate cyclase domain-containing protein [Gammaproteobacteria bacterium]